MEKRNILFFSGVILFILSIYVSYWFDIGIMAIFGYACGEIPTNKVEDEVKIS